MKLYIDCATKYLVVALASESNIISMVIKEGFNNHSETLALEVDKMLSENDLKVQRLTSIIVGEGPGSYTGVRVAVVFAKVLAMVLKIPLYKMNSLAVVASAKPGIVAIELHAKKNYIFNGVFENGHTIKPVKFCHVDDKYTDFPVSKSITAIDVNNILLELVEDIDSFGPNYYRKWND